MGSYWDDYNIGDLVGKTFTKVERLYDEEIRFILEDGSYYRMYHSQDCCESVTIEEVIGDLEDLVDTPILVAEERSNSSDDDNASWENTDDDDSYQPESWTWTFYEIRTNKGSVTIRWLGSSNGYYSESVNIAYIGKDEVS